MTVNADAEAFYVLNAGKDLVRTREQLKAKRAKEREEKEKRRREREQKKQVLELEQVEDLKDKLVRHMQEIRRLFGEGDMLPDLEDGAREDGRLID